MTTNKHPPTRARCAEIAETCTFFNVRKASRILADTFDQELRPFGLHGTQFSLLVAISLLEETTVRRLAEAVAADRTTLTRTLAPLERDGLITSAAGSDRRERLLRLTVAGQARLAAALTGWERAQRSVVARMGKDAWHHLMTGTRAVHGLATDVRAPQERVASRPRRETGARRGGTLRG